ncbi:lysophospholipid acyltransferase family protein [Parachitinimonas caeni]|uniref:Lysophospholipid acyltransferase family protein n=1 Tax=Parachitinimonas caeni TaxID=3031301 RepID=A0ABT7DS96_9NEIS|nr:lysophospholipid acyltransferase family protein [Parachitinimonas caeni]MDK2122943.1 lysophospholipid acyltransferase family protein [Parachitinimonas caeni]
MPTFILKLFAHLPLPFIHALGTLLGWIAYWVDGTYARRLTENLRQSGLAVGADDYSRLRRASIGEAGRGALEVLAAWGRAPDRVAALVKNCDGWQHVEAALAARRPLLFITPHLGGFDVAGRYVASRLPFPLTAMYRPPKLSWLEPLMNAGRVRGNGRTAPATAAGVRQLLKTLKQSEAVVILPDQVPGAGEGVWAPFFGKPAFTMTLLPRLAKSADACVLFFFAERLPWGRGYRVRILPMVGEFNGDRSHDAALLNHNLEHLIRLAPAQYLWSYNRYKQPAGADPAPEQTANLS